MNTRSQEVRYTLKEELVATNDSLVIGVPKIELHVHIEGTLTPELRWKLAKRKGIPTPFGRPGHSANSIEELRDMYKAVISSAQLNDFVDKPEETIPATFFQAYYSGFEVLREKQDFYDLAYNYFERAAAANVRYCEIFFDPQGHTSQGVSWHCMMDGFREAQKAARAILNVRRNAYSLIPLMKDLIIQGTLAMDYVLPA